MELVLIIQIVFLLLAFIVSFVFVVLPVRLIPRDSTKPIAKRSQRLVTLANCFAGGVFLATCFVQLIPHVEAKFTESFLLGHLPIKYCASLSQFVTMLGFFLVLLLEQFIKMCHRGNKVGKSEEESQEMSNLRSYIVAVSSSQSEDSEESDVELVRQERKKMLKKSKSSKAETSGDKLEVNSTTRSENNLESVKSAERSGSGLVRVKKCRVRASGNGASCDHLSDTDRYILTAASTGRKEFSNLRSVILLLALGIHSLFEGIAVGLQDEFWSLINLIVGITMHSCLMSFALGISLARLTASEASRLSLICKIAAAFSVAMPIGVGIGMAVEILRAGHMFVSSLVSAILQALTAGTFIYVIFFDILVPPELDNGKEGLLKIFITFIGFMIVCALRFVIAT